MEFRTDLVYSIPQYGGQGQGLLTLGESKTIQLENGKNIELQPYLLQTHCTRGTSKNDPRIRMSNDVAIPQLAKAYAEHYNNACLGEHWTTEEVEAMLKWQLGQSLGRYFFIKWAKDLENNNEFPIGFFCAYIKPYQSGQMIWDGELFVLPEYRNFGIGTELIQVLFTVAKSSGVDFFESLTYEDENGYPLKFWQKLGADRDDLIHIYGETEKILLNIEENKNHKTL
jgi:GNAT superfamily N-acetyltransferase